MLHDLSRSLRKIKSQLLMIQKCVHLSAEIQKPKDFREFRRISEKKKNILFACEFQKS